MLNQPNVLCTILTLDAVTCLATGTLMAVAATPLSSLMLIPANVLWIAGMSLFPIAVFIAVVAPVYRDLSQVSGSSSGATPPG